MHGEGNERLTVRQSCGEWQAIATRFPLKL
jgi:hypothetical protein